MTKQHLFFVAILVIVSITGACKTKEPETIVETVIVEKEGETIVETVVVTVEATEEIAVDECCDVYRIGIFEEPVSLNYWNYLGAGSSVWTRYVVLDDAAHLFDLSDKRFQFIPSLAKDIPTPVENSDGSWSVTVEMVDEAIWSDGEPITAHDVVFTHNVCKDLILTWNWPTYCSPGGADVVAEAIEDFTVQYTYLNQAPSLSNWQFGVAMAPILPKHFWAKIVAEANGFIENVEIPEIDRPENCKTGDLIGCDSWAAYDDAYSQAQHTLYQADALDQPVAGGYIIEDWEPGQFIRLTANEQYYFRGAEIIEYEDGTWLRIMPDGTQYQFYGDAEGDETLRYTVGPYNPEIEFSIYNSQEAAFLALSVGEIDYVLNPLPLTRDLRERVMKNDSIKTYVNADYDMYYLAFNMMKYPMSEHEFRQAFDIIIDRDFVINQVLGGVVNPLYSTMPPGNQFWHNPNILEQYVGLNRAERIDVAVQVLKQAGWSWENEPYWDDFIQAVVPGDGLVMPDGEPMPELTLLGPGPAFDPIRATINQWISEWARELGMPVKSEMTGRNAILDAVFIAADYDMYIYGWGLGQVAFPAYFEEFWHSRNCTFETGNKNTTCFKNTEYDVLVDEFMITGDIERAQELVYQMQVLLADQRPFIPLYSEQVHDFAREHVIFPYTEILDGIESQDGLQTATQVLFK